MADAVDSATTRAADGEPASAAAASAADGGEGLIALCITDLLPDAQGEVVFLNDAGVSALNIFGAQPVIGSGISDHHTTAQGIDVTGMAYSTFETGLTVYYPPDVTLLLT